TLLTLLALLVSLLLPARVLLALLTLLPLLPIPRVLLRLVAHPLVERLHAAHQIASLVDSTPNRILLVGLAERRLGIADLALQPVEVRLDVGFHRLCIVARLAAQRVLRIADLLAHPL